MSELQAILQARRRRMIPQGGGGGGGGTGGGGSSAAGAENVPSSASSVASSVISSSSNAPSNAPSNSSNNAASATSTRNVQGGYGSYGGHGGYAGYASKTNKMKDDNAKAGKTIYGANSSNVNNPSVKIGQNKASNAKNSGYLAKAGYGTKSGNVSNSATATSSSPSESVGNAGYGARKFGANNNATAVTTNNNNNTTSNQNSNNQSSSSSNSSNNYNSNPKSPARPKPQSWTYATNNADSVELSPSAVGRQALRLNTGATDTFDAGVSEGNTNDANNADNAGSGGPSIPSPSAFGAARDKFNHQLSPRKNVFTTAVASGASYAARPKPSPTSQPLQPPQPSHLPQSQRESTSFTSTPVEPPKALSTASNASYASSTTPSNVSNAISNASRTSNASELQKKLRERRMKAAETFKHVKQSQHQQSQHSQKSQVSQQSQSQSEQQNQQSQHNQSFPQQQSQQSQHPQQPQQPQQTQPQTQQTQQSQNSQQQQNIQRAQENQQRNKQPFAFYHHQQSFQSNVPQQPPGGYAHSSSYHWASKEDKGGISGKEGKDEAGGVGKVVAEEVEKSMKKDLEREAQQSSPASLAVPSVGPAGTSVTTPGSTMQTATPTPTSSAATAATPTSRRSTFFPRSTPPIRNSSNSSNESVGEKGPGNVVETGETEEANGADANDVGQSEEPAAAAAISTATTATKEPAATSLGKTPASPRRSEKVDFNRTVAGRARSGYGGYGRNSASNVQGTNQNRSMLSIMAAKYKEDSLKHQQEQLQEKEELEKKRLEEEEGQSQEGPGEESNQPQQQQSPSGYMYRPGMRPPASSPKSSNIYNYSSPKSATKSFVPASASSSVGSVASMGSASSAGSNKFDKFLPGNKVGTTTSNSNAAQTAATSTKTSTTTHNASLNRWMNHNRHRGQQPGGERSGERSVVTDATVLGGGKSSVSVTSGVSAARSDVGSATGSVTGSDAASVTGSVADSTVGSTTGSAAKKTDEDIIPGFLRRGLKPTHDSSAEDASGAIGAAAATGSVGAESKSADAPQKMNIKERWRPPTSPSHASNAMSPSNRGGVGGVASRYTPPSSQSNNSRQFSPKSYPPPSPTHSYRPSPPVHPSPPPSPSWRRKDSTPTDEEDDTGDTESRTEEERSIQSIQSNQSKLRLSPTLANNKFFQMEASTNQQTKGQAARPKPIGKALLSREDGESQSFPQDLHGDLHEVSEQEGVGEANGDEHQHEVEDDEEEVVEEDDDEEGEYDEDEPYQQKRPFLSPYDAAVMAAKREIDASNRSRSQRSKGPQPQSPGSQQSQQSPGSQQSQQLQDEFEKDGMRDVGDPELRIEASPDSSVTDEPGPSVEESELQRGKMANEEYEEAYEETQDETYRNTNQDEYGDAENAPLQSADGFHVRDNHLQGRDAPDAFFQSNAMASLQQEDGAGKSPVNSFFESSFLTSSNVFETGTPSGGADDVNENGNFNFGNFDEGAYSKHDQNAQPTQEEQYGDPFFGSDPFAPFAEDEARPTSTFQQEQPEDSFQNGGIGGAEQVLSHFVEPDHVEHSQDSQEPQENRQVTVATVAGDDGGFQEDPFFNANFHEERIGTSSNHIVESPQQTQQEELDQEHSERSIPINEESHSSIQEYSRVSFPTPEKTDGSFDYSEAEVSFGDHHSEEFVVDSHNPADGDIGDENDVFHVESDHLRALVIPPVKRDHDFSYFNIQPLELSFGPAANIGRIPSPISNPLTGSIIACRCNENGDFFLEEIDASHRPTPIAVMSAALLSNDLRSKLARSMSVPNDVKVVGVTCVHSVAAGVHRVNGHARVRVATLFEVIVIGKGIPNSKNGMARMKVVAVWKWGYNPGGKDLASLQSILTMNNIEDYIFDPKTLQVADGLLFLGGHTIPAVNATSEPVVFIAKPAVRDSWVSVVIDTVPVQLSQEVPESSNRSPKSDNLSVSVLSASNDTNTFLAVGLNDGSISVWSYGLAARTNRITGMNVQIGTKKSLNQTPSLLQPLCQIRGESDVRELKDEDCLWREEKFVTFSYRASSNAMNQEQYYKTSSNNNQDCMSLSWIHPFSSGISSLPLLAAAFSSGIAVYHVSLPIQHDLTPPAADSMSELSAGSDELASIKRQRARASKGSVIAKTSIPSSLSAAVVIAPMAQAKFSTFEEDSKKEAIADTIFSKPRAKVSWFDLGPRSPPCIGLLFEHEKVSYQMDTLTLISRKPVTRLCLCAIDIPWYGSIEMMSFETKQMHRPIGVICQEELNTLRDGSTIMNLSELGAIACYHSGSLLSCKPSLLPPTIGSKSATATDRYFSSQLRPVLSNCLGLDSSGSVFLSGEKAFNSDYQDTMLTVFTVTTCNREDMPPLSDLPESKPSRSPHYRNWSIPSQRHWLIISSPGDKKIDGLTESLSTGDHDDVMSASEQNDRVKSGAVSSVLCELTCGENPLAGLVPERIVREQGGRRAAVLFSSGFFGSNAADFNESTPRTRTHTRIKPDPVAFAILDVDEGMKKCGSVSFNLRHGRDVAFLPPSRTEGGFYCSSLVVLDSIGSSLSITTAITSDTLPDGENEKVVESIDKCSLHFEGIEGRRVFTLLNGPHLEILLAGYSTVVGRPCLVLSNHELRKDHQISAITLIENSGLGHRLWLRQGEEVISLVELPKHRESSRSNVAVATQSRVMILSTEDSLTVLSEIDTSLTCGSLSPLGSHCVAFSSSTFGRNSSIMYLSCLDKTGKHGVIADIPASHQGNSMILLGAVRPDRFVFFTSQSGIRLVDDGDDENKFVLRLPTTRPLFLLEPLIANALCQDRARGYNAETNNDVQQSLRVVVEKYGRKDSSFPFGDKEGIGTHGTGLTSQAYNMLAQYNCSQAASALLDGTVVGSSSRLKILPPWVPMVSKLSAINEVDSSLQVLVAGDNALSHQVINSDRNVQAIFPKPFDPSSIFAEDMAIKSLKEDLFSDAIKLFDFSGKQSSESLSMYLALLSQAKEPLGRKKMLEAYFDAGTYTSSETASIVNKKNHLVPAVALQLSKLHNNLETESINDVSVNHFAPSLQPCYEFERARSGPTSVDSIAAYFAQPVRNEVRIGEWEQPLDHGKHVWTSGPFGKKEGLLELEDFEDWLGRCRPTVLGKEGVAVAAETGEQTLANILSAAAREEEGGSSQEESDSNSVSSKHKSWVQGIGESHLDEDNLALYVRFSEGADEDDRWKVDGVSDLTKHGHKIHLYGSDYASLEATTSSADEGEEGKVQLLYDLVYDEGAPRNQPTGAVVEVMRGSSLDIGMLHGSQQKSRKRCTVELWYHLPQAEIMTDEIILARRSLFYEENNDASKLCLPDEKHNTLWEVAVLPSGILELRTGAGSVVTTQVHFDEDDEEKSRGLVSWEREDGGGGWNHLCLVFSSLPFSSPTELSASIFMNGSAVVTSANLTVNPFGSEPEINEDDIEDAMEKTVLVFGIGPSVGFRVTDIRVWACQRSEDDIKMMMYEHLKDAEIKKKLKVNIRMGTKKANGVSAIRLPQPETKKIAPFSSPRSSQSRRVLNTEQAETVGNDSAKFEPSFANFGFSEDHESTPLVRIEENKSAEDIINAKESETRALIVPSEPPQHFDTVQMPTTHQREQASSIDEDVDTLPTKPSFVVLLSDLISTMVRKSAATAIIRGPPASRHFGGNRGGLASSHRNFGPKHDGISPIAICGHEKSIVFFSDRDPPGKTYPIGASGAVLSDVMDENKSEYMCCFLAKEKRMVVFELTRKTVIVELQMKTKLNFWRYLPPEAHGSELAFMLITPVGGFHWKPLDEMPRPRQVWKRGPELESKKILTYEEGGSNGEIGSDARSTVALVLASSVTSDSNVEAFCILLGEIPSTLCISTNILGAALYHPLASIVSPSHFLPFVVSVSEDEKSQYVLSVEDLRDGESSDANENLVRGDALASVILEDTDSAELLEPPPMSMGIHPEVFCCCNDGFIVAVLRRKGMVFAYDFLNGSLDLVGKSRLGHYIVDAAIRSGDSDGEVELVLLLCAHEDQKDGRISTINISRA